MLNSLSRKHLALLAVACLLVYANSFRNNFVWDDHALVLNNSFLPEWRNVPKLFTTNLFAGAEEQSSFYRPLQALTFMVDYHLWGKEPFGFHLTNTLLHLTNALLLYYLLASMTNPQVAFIAGLLFIVHPLQTEAITYIAGRADPLALGFLLTALLCYRKSGARPGTNLWGVASLVAFLLALLSKEMAMILPALLILYDLIADPPAHPRDLLGRFGRRYLPYLVVLVAYGAGRRLVTDLHMTPGGPSLTFSQRLLLSLSVFGEYLWILALPRNLHMERTVPIPDSPATPAVLIGALALLLLMGAAYWAWPRMRALTFGIGWFILGFLPISNLVPLNAYMAEHWMYLPAIGLFLAVGLAIEMTRGHTLRRWAIGLFAVVVAFDAGTAIRRNQDWKDGETFYTLTLKAAPDSWRVHANLGFMYVGRREFDRAIEPLQSAVRLNAFETTSYVGLGRAYEGLGRDQEAIAEFEKALLISPRAPGAHRHLAQLYMKMGAKERAALHFETIPREERLQSILTHLAAGDRHMEARQYPEAVKAYQQALENSPADADLRSKLGLAYAAMGDGERARQEYERALKTNPESVNTRNYLGALLMQKEMWKEAVEQFREVLLRLPNHADARNNLGIAYYQLGRMPEAETELRKALMLRPDSKEIKVNLEKIASGRPSPEANRSEQAQTAQPDSARVHYERGSAYGSRGDLDKAAKEFDVALRLDPSNPLIHYAIGLIRYQRGERDQAQRAWERALKLDPTFTLAKERLAELKAAAPAAARAR